MPNLVEIRDLKIGARTNSGREVQIIKGVSIDVAAGEIVALMGNLVRARRRLRCRLWGMCGPGAISRAAR